MLNDARLLSRSMVAGLGAALGLIVGGVVHTDDSSLLLLLVVGGSVLELGVTLLWQGVLSGADRRIRDDAARGAAEIASGAVTPVRAAARVVRSRSDRGHDWFLPAAGWGRGRARLLVLTALTPTRPRRVVTLVPDTLALHRKGAPAVVLLHPHRPDVAVVDDRVSAAELEAVDHDPGWQQRLPTDGSIAGGYAVLLTVFVLSVAVVAVLVALLP